MLNIDQNKIIANNAIGKVFNKFGDLIKKDLPNEICFMESDEFYAYLKSRKISTISDINSAGGFYEPEREMIFVRDDQTIKEKKFIVTHETLHFLAGQWLSSKNGIKQMKAGLQINESYFLDKKLFREVYNIELNEMFVDLLSSKVLGININKLFSENPAYNENIKKIKAFKNNVIKDDKVIEYLKIAYFTCDENIFLKSLASVQNNWANSVQFLLFTRYRHQIKENL